jgi:hypothetical protein
MFLREKSENFEKEMYKILLRPSSIYSKNFFSEDII